MMAAAIFENRHITISQQRLDRSSRNLARWCILAGWLISSLQAVENLTFQKSSMVHGRCLNNRKSRYVGKGLANRENLILMQPRLIGAAAKITNPNRQPTLTILLQNQNMFGGWAKVDCFRCLNIATNDNNDIRLRGLLLRMIKDNLIKFCHTVRYRLFLRFVFQHLA